MGLCLSNTRSVSVPYGDGPREVSPQHQRQPNAAPMTRNDGIGLDAIGLAIPSSHRQRRETFQQNYQHTAFPPQFKNRFIEKLSEQKHLFTTEQQEAITRLEIYDERKHIGLKNKDILPIENAFENSDKTARIALKRTASFLLVNEILLDMVEAGCEVITDDNSHRFFTQSLLTVQAEAIRHQVQIGKHEVLNKIANKERIAPLSMETAKFDRFLRNETKTLREIVQVCRTDGNIRETQLSAALQNLAQNYLKLGRRLPAGLEAEQYVMVGDTKIKEKVNVVIRSDWHFAGDSSTTDWCPEDNPRMILITIDPEDLMTASDDPCDGSPDERFYALGFEHCVIAEKQAAVFIQKLFYELSFAELSIAYDNAGKSTVSIDDANVVARSRFDTEYYGSIALGDQCQMTGLDPTDQRKPLIDRVAMLNGIANAFPNMFDDEPLFLDQDLNCWMQGPRFQKDLSCLKHPERRAWIANVEIVKSALQRMPIFSACERGR